jgi:hypothetical protein
MKHCESGRVFFAGQDAGGLPAKLDSGSWLTFYLGYLELYLEQEPRPCFGFLGGNSHLLLNTTGAISVWSKKYR